MSTGGKAARGAALVDLGIWLACIVAAMAVSTVANHGFRRSSLFAALSAPLLMLAMFGLATVLLRRRGEDWRGLGLTRPTSVRRVLALIVGGYLCLVGFSAVLNSGVSRPPRRSASLAILSGLAGHPVAYGGWLALAWTSAALGEELQFRGFVRSRLERLFGEGRGATVAALLGQAALFGLGHVYQGMAGVLLTMCAGLVLGGVFLLGRRNLIACMLLHGMIDTISLTVVFLGLARTAGIG